MTPLAANLAALRRRDSSFGRARPPLWVRWTQRVQRTRRAGFSSVSSLPCSPGQLASGALFVAPHGGRGPASPGSQRLPGYAAARATRPTCPPVCSSLARVPEREANRVAHFDQRRDFASDCLQESVRHEHHARIPVPCRTGSGQQGGACGAGLMVRAVCDNAAGKAVSREISPPKCATLLPPSSQA
jgi:hypothetical protein